MYEGEVTELKPEETENPLGGYGKTIAHLIVTLKTTKGTKQLRLDPTIYTAFQKERVAVGDVIYIEANSGAVKRLGRSDAYATEFDLEAEEYVPLPKGDVHKRREIAQDVTLHDLDQVRLFSFFVQWFHLVKCVIISQNLRLMLALKEGMTLCPQWVIL